MGNARGGTPGVVKGVVRWRELCSRTRGGASRGRKFEGAHAAGVKPTPVRGPPVLPAQE